jgi:hypothetical protein
MCYTKWYCQVCLACPAGKVQIKVQVYKFLVQVNVVDNRLKLESTSICTLFFYIKLLPLKSSFCMQATPPAKQQAIPSAEL